MNYIIFIILGLAPSIIWLLFYLRKDKHPESKRMILKIFFYGIIAAVIVAIIEIEISFGLGFFGGEFLERFPILFFLFSQFIIIALVEELSKYLIVKEKVTDDPEFDEPVDAMIYMIVAALGFAALENSLVLFLGPKPMLIREALVISSLRFVGATFLHALCSGTLGYFLALSLFESKNRFKLILTGITIAVLLHGLFNISIIKIEESLIAQDSLQLISSIIFLFILLSGLAFFVSFGFRKLKKLASVCLPAGDVPKAHKVK